MSALIITVKEKMVKYETLNIMYLNCVSDFFRKEYKELEELWIQLFFPKIYSMFISYKCLFHTNV